MTDLSKSPGRGFFQKAAHLTRCADEGKSPNQDYLDMFDSWAEQTEKLEASDEWKIDNLEYDLRTTAWILEKVRGSDSYAQNLYAALCNNDFQKLDVMPILANKTWSCSWRHAGGIVADMRQRGDYIDWYCSGIRGEMDNDQYQQLTKAQQERYLYVKNHYVSESAVTEEIQNDLLKLGWQVMESEPEII